MKKINLFEKFNRGIYALLMLAAVSFTFTACDDDDDDDNPEPTMDVVETLTDLGGYDSLIKYVSNYPNLVTILNNSDEKTLFAPNNAAFVGLLATPGFPQDIRTITPAIIENVLTYHVVLGSEVTSSELTGSITTAYNNEVIEVNADGTLLTGSSNPSISLGETDIRTTTGIIHEVNTVLIPPSVGTTLTPILGTVAGTVLLGADFSELAFAIQRVDSVRAAAQEMPIASILANRAEDYTVFAPVNGSFEAAGIDITTIDVEALEAALLLHVVSGSNLSAADIQGLVTDGEGSATVETLGGNITVTPTEFQGNSTLSAGGAAVVSADNVAGNGTVHAVFGVVAAAE